MHFVMKDLTNHSRSALGGVNAFATLLPVAEVVFSFLHMTVAECPSGATDTPW